MAKNVFFRDKLGIKEYNSRSKFIEGKPFEGLDDYFNSNEIKVLQKNVKCDLKNSDNSNPLENGLLHKIGAFYEHLIQGIYGGELKEQYKLQNGLLEKIIEPDLSCNSFDRDAKSVSPTRYLRLKDNQMAGYSLLETGKYAPKKEITFEIFRHGVKNLLTKFKDEEIKLLCKELSKSTKFMISLPFRVAFDIYASEKCSWQEEVLSPSCKDSRYAHSHGSYSRIDSGPLNALLAYPEETLEYFGVEMSGLKIIKSKFPEGIKINRFTLTPFPILIIENQNPTIWRQRFLNMLDEKSKCLPENFYEYMDQFLFEIENPEPEETEIPVQTPEEDIPF